MTNEQSPAQGMTVTPSNQVVIDISGALPGQVLVAVLKDGTRLCLYPEGPYNAIRIVPELAPTKVQAIALEAARRSLELNSDHPERVAKALGRDNLAGMEPAGLRAAVAHTLLAKASTVFAVANPASGGYQPNDINVGKHVTVSVQVLSGWTDWADGPEYDRNNTERLTLGKIVGFEVSTREGELVRCASQPID